MADAGQERYDYLVRSASTDTFGRVLLSARDQHVVVDGPIQNGCPGEAITPAELFLGGVASCAVELIHVIAREWEIPIAGLEAWMSGVIDRSHQVRSDLTVFSSAALRLAFHGVGDDDAARLVASFKGR